MSLMKNPPSNALPDQLLSLLMELGNLVQSLSEGNYKKIISDIKAEKDKLNNEKKDLSELMAQDAQKTKELSVATEENNKSISDLERLKLEANQAKAEADAQINKASIAKRELEDAQEVYNEKIKNDNAALSAREAAVSVREAAVKQGERENEMMRDELQTKLDNLKKITA